jgi:hypothetical protein
MFAGGSPTRQGDLVLKFRAVITCEGIPADTIIEQLQERGAKVSMLVREDDPV